MGLPSVHELPRESGRLHRMSRVRWALVALLLASVGCGEGCPFTRERQVVRLESVDDAIEHAKSSKALEFHAVVRIDLAGYKMWSVRPSRGQGPATPRTAAMVPVVPEGWTPEDEVPLWIRVDARADGPEHPKLAAKLEELRAAAEAGPITVSPAQQLKGDIDMEGTNAFQIGAKRAMDEHGLRSPIGAPLASWPAKPGKLRLKD